MYLALALPPGITRNGTQYQSKGRWYDANLVRFYEGTIRPWGGWRAKTTNTVTGKGRAIITWKDNSALAWCAVGTEQKLYAISRSGFVTDITPMGFATGYADALISVGFGTGLYGSGDYGVSSSGGTTIAYARAYGGGNYGSGIYRRTPEPSSMRRSGASIPGGSICSVSPPMTAASGNGCWILRPRRLCFRMRPARGQLLSPINAS
jgi:hypothetical protein